MHIQAGYVFVDERQKRKDKVNSGDDEWAHNQDEVLEVSTSASNQENVNYQDGGSIQQATG